MADLSAFDAAVRPAQSTPDLSAFDAAMSPPASRGADLSAFDAAAAPTATSEKLDVEKLAETRDDHVVGQSDIDTIAARHSVDPGLLREATGWLSGVLAPEDRRGVEHVTEGLKSTVGAIGEGVGFGLPQKLAITLRSDPAQRAALDDLRELIQKRKSIGETIGEVGAGLVVPVGVGAKAVEGLSGATKAAVLAAEGVGLGAIGGYAQSREGEELSGAALGAGLGLGFVGVAGVASKIASRVSKRTTLEAAEAVERAAHETSRDTVGEATTRMAANRESEDVLERLVLDQDETRRAARRDITSFVEATTEPERAALAKLAPPDMKLNSRHVQLHGEEAAQAFKVTREAAGDLQLALGTGRRRGGVADVIAQEDIPHVRKEYRLTRETKYTRDVLAETGEKAAGWSGFLRKTKDFISDLRYATDSMDRRLGTRLTPVIDRLSGNFNLFTGDLLEAGARQKTMNRLLLAAEREPTPSGAKFEMRRTIESSPGARGDLTPNQRAAVAAWEEGFEWARQKAGELGQPITRLVREDGGGYVPEIPLDPVQYVLKMDEVGARLGVGEDASDVALRALIARAEEGSQLHAEYLRGLKGAVKDARVDTAEGVRDAIRRMSDLDRTGTSLQSAARAAFQRKGETPEWLLEQDVSKLFMKWAHNTFRHARIRGDLAELRSAARAVRATDEASANYLEQHVRDLVGVGAGSVAEAQGRKLTQLQLRLARASARTKDPTKKWFLAAASELPHMLSGVSAQIYPYVLGARVDKIITNLTSPLLVGLPSTGLRSMKYWGGGAVQAATTWLRNPKSFARQLTDLGLAPADATFEMHRWMRDGVERSTVRRLGRGAVDGLAKFAMLAYQQTDLITRGVTYHAARGIARDIATDATLRREIFEHISPGYRHLIAEKLARNEDVSVDVARWLNGYTQFNYNRASMSEYGRTLGGLFSTFSKWPTSVGGEILYRLEAGTAEGRLRPELLKLAMKYMAPAICIRMIGAALYASEGGDVMGEGDSWEKFLADKPVAASIVGKPNNWAPIGSVDSVDKLITSAPVPRTAWGLTKAAVKQDVHAAAATAGEAVAMFTPGNWIARLYYKDIPAYLGEGNRGKPQDLLLEDLTD